jgi:hypothetical protein
MDFGCNDNDNEEPRGHGANANTGERDGRWHEGGNDTDDGQDNSSSNEEPPPLLHDTTTTRQPSTPPDEQHATRLQPHEQPLMEWMVGGMAMTMQGDGSDTTTAEPLCGGWV